jgi:hypothetical protein
MKLLVIFDCLIEIDKKLHTHLSLILSVAIDTN